YPRAERPRLSGAMSPGRGSRLARVRLDTRRDPGLLHLPGDGPLACGLRLVKGIPDPRAPHDRRRDLATAVPPASASPSRPRISDDGSGTELSWISQMVPLRPGPPPWAVP